MVGIEGLEAYASEFSNIPALQSLSVLIPLRQNGVGCSKMNNFWSDVENLPLGGRSMAQPKGAGELNVVQMETDLLQRWGKEATFQASISARRSNAPFIFLEGPSNGQRKAGHPPRCCSNLQRPRLPLEDDGGLPR
jgi:hypothetical protein